MALNRELLHILACPKCRGDLRLLPGEDGLVCDTPCGVVYPIREEIPVMLIEESVPLAEWDKGVRESDRKRPADG